MVMLRLRQRDKQLWQSRMRWVMELSIEMFRGEARQETHEVIDMDADISLSGDERVCCQCLMPQDYGIASGQSITLLMN